MALTPLHVRDVCYAGYQGTYCKYITSEYNKNGTVVSLCTKLNTGAYEALKKKQRGSSGGDNCPGYLYLKHKKQGYDVK